jgi:hypothetical protein
VRRVVPAMNFFGRSKKLGYQACHVHDRTAL